MIRRIAHHPVVMVFAGLGVLKRLTRSLTIGGWVGLTLLTGNAESPPWSLYRRSDEHEWLTIRGEQRMRYETLSHQFRAALAGSDQLLGYRTGLFLRGERGPWVGVVEFVDSRQSLADAGSPVSPSIVNTLSILQGYLEYRTSDAAETWIRVGRQTMDVGSRRLVARNRYRNAINNFTGIRGQWRVGSDALIHVFYTLPVERRPVEKARLLENEYQFDDESFGRQFWGVLGRFPDKARDATVEVYAIGLHERDHESRETRDRRLLTPGIRYFRDPEPGAWDFALESAYQLGTASESSSPSARADIPRRAHLQSVDVGYTFEDSGRSRVALRFNAISGDADPDDATEGGFDSLYGARRFDYGATGIYGPFSCSNLLSPGMELTTSPIPNSRIIFTTRAFWLSSPKDDWSPAGIRDPSGQSGRYVGTQPEVRFRWDVVPERFRIDIGLAHLFLGRFPRMASYERSLRSPTYIYAQTSLWF